LRDPKTFVTPKGCSHPSNAPARGMRFGRGRALPCRAAIANEARALYREYIPLKISFRIHCRVLFWLSDIRNIGVSLDGSAVDRDLGHASCAGIEQMLTKPG
jgi:hypothetical protein